MKKFTSQEIKEFVSRPLFNEAVILNEDTSLPKISIVTPSYNQGQFIENTILSVKNQDYPNIEHIIVDGGSTDNTLEILKKYDGTYNMQWISEPDEGQADAVNKGFVMAKGEIIGWLNSDDVYLTRKVVSRVVNEFARQLDIDVVHGNRITIDEENRLMRLYYSRNFNFDQCLKGNCTIFQETAFFRKSIVDKYQLDASLQLAIDTEYWLRMGKMIRFKHINAFLGGFRLHLASKSVSNHQDLRWNAERKSLSDKYGLRYQPRASEGILAEIFIRIRRLLAGSYMGYCQLLLDIMQLVLSPEDRFAFPIKIDEKKLLIYFVRSAIPTFK